MTGRLAALLADPAAVASVPVAEVPALLAALAAEQARLAALEALLAARLAAAGAPSPPTTATLLTAHAVAERLQVPAQRVYELVRSGELPAIRCGKYLRVDPAALARWEAAHPAYAAPPRRLTTGLGQR